eukprot:12146207-Alexandrium_andersonii.AAC.1
MQHAPLRTRTATLERGRCAQKEQAVCTRVKLLSLTRFCTSLPNRDSPDHANACSHCSRPQLGYPTYALVGAAD